jgi:hypothetical protein
MPNKAAEYVVVALRAAGEPTQIEHMFRGAPSDARLASWCRQRSQPYDVVVRYFPSRKGWLVLDMRNVSVRIGPNPGSPVYWHGIQRSTRVYATESAAVMKAMYMLHPPTQHNLSL